MRQLLDLWLTLTLLKLPIPGWLSGLFGGGGGLEIAADGTVATNGQVVGAGQGVAEVGGHRVFVSPGAPDEWVRVTPDGKADYNVPVPPGYVKPQPQPYIPPEDPNTYHERMMAEQARMQMMLDSIGPGPGAGVSSTGAPDTTIELPGAAAPSWAGNAPVTGIGNIVGLTDIHIRQINEG